MCRKKRKTRERKGDIIKASERKNKQMKQENMGREERKMKRRRRNMEEKRGTT